jgi:hypothetical protein
VSDIAVRTLKHDITIRTNGEAEFAYLAGVPEVAGTRTQASIDIQREGTFLSAAWRGLAPSFLARIASARDLAVQIDSELAELSLLDARPGMVLSSSLLAWRGKRLLVLGPQLPRTALAMALFRSKVDIEGNWACRLSAKGFTALPRSMRWGTNLLRAYPETEEMAADAPAHQIGSGHGEFWAWCPAAGERRWCCRDGTVDGIVVADSMAGGRSLARRLAREMVWGHLMAARIAGNGGLPAAMVLKSLAASAPAVRLSVGDLAGAADLTLEFLAELA